VTSSVSLRAEYKVHTIIFKTGPHITGGSPEPCNDGHGLTCQFQATAVERAEGFMGCTDGQGYLKPTVFHRF